MLIDSIGVRTVAFLTDATPTEVSKWIRGTARVPVALERGHAQRHEPSLLSRPANLASRYRRGSLPATRSLISPPRSKPSKTTTTTQPSTLQVDRDELSSATSNASSPAPRAASERSQALERQPTWCRSSRFHRYTPANTHFRKPSMREVARGLSVSTRQRYGMDGCVAAARRLCESSGWGDWTVRSSWCWVRVARRSSIGDRSG